MGYFLENSDIDRGPHTIFPAEVSTGAESAGSSLPVDARQSPMGPPVRKLSSQQISVFKLKPSRSSSAGVFFG
jgi:hypothetical protein